MVLKLWLIPFNFVIIILSKEMLLYFAAFPANNYLFKVNNWNTKTVCEIYSELTMKTPERHQWSFLMFSLLTLKRFYTLLWCCHCWLWASKCHLLSHNHMIFSLEIIKTKSKAPIEKEKLSFGQRVSLSFWGHGRQTNSEMNSPHSFFFLIIS